MANEYVVNSTQLHIRRRDSVGYDQRAAGTDQALHEQNESVDAQHVRSIVFFDCVLSFLLLLVVFVFPASGGVSKRRGERVFYMSFPSRLLLCVFFVSSLCLLSSRVGSALTLVCAKFSR